MKRWLKYGLILGGIAALVIILNFLYCLGRELEFCTVPILIISLPILFVLNFLEDIGRFGGIYFPSLFMPIVIIFYFAIGAIIGLIVSKIKKDKN